MAERDAPAAPRVHGLGLVTAFLTVLVAFNTLVYSCSNDRLARENAHLQRFASDEKFWTDAMQDLSTLVGERGKAGADPKVWDAQCKLLALRTSPFSFDPGGSGERDDAKEHLSARAQADETRVRLLKLAFTERIQDPRFVTDGCRRTFASQQFAAAQDDATTIVPAVPAATPDPAATAPPAVAYQADSATSSAITQRSNIIALTPPSAAGWDIDVFWCDRANGLSAARNYAEALAVAQLLAGFAQNGQRIGGESLGRIRARILPLERQGRQFFPSRGAQIRADAGPGEAALAAALRDALPAYGFATGGSRNATRWYLSMFLCRAPGLPAVVPAKAGA